MKKIISSIIIVFIISFFVFTFYDKSYTNKIVNYNGNDLLISIDGVLSKNLPSEGNYYLTRYKCGSKSTKVIWDNDSKSLSITNGSRDAGVVCNLTFESKPKLTSMSNGSYVKYTGNNGCSGNKCSGYNANYVNDDDMGYCDSKDNKYVSNGWRLMYSNEDTAYLVSGGGLECVTKSANSTNSLLFVNELNSKAISYCNKKYVYGGVCNNYSVRSITDEDFNKYLNMKIGDCLNNYSNKFCGYNDDLIDNGGYYFFASVYDSAFNKLFAWDPVGRVISNDSYVKNYGLRVIIRLNSSVYVVSGDGSYSNPYVISID